ncbi:hypothetical protein E2562_017202 [Oryza meyeriana var. granulata]|uniref:Uncharacterized protein n=1 Tax=Oryza meyeriana var. granulata TaxID=110450 RepID=A0A6G1EKN7_9ORYZ|nr:hypothetical protein E2562_017202 [Oryza meyeriana var. granulata]
MSEAGEEACVVAECVLPGERGGCQQGWHGGGGGSDAKVGQVGGEGNTNIPQAAAQHKSANAAGFSFRLQEPAEKRKEV